MGRHENGAEYCSLAEVAVKEVSDKRDAWRQLAYDQDAFMDQLDRLSDLESGMRALVRQAELRARFTSLSGGAGPKMV